MLIMHVQDLEAIESSFDTSQLQALQHSLSSRVALVQGPPGTGKTFTGVALCKLILKHSSATILCVCYTNHALDQFLEALMDQGITEIVRIGSRSKSKRLEQYNLRELDRNSRTKNLSFSENRRLFQVHAQLESVQEKMLQLAKLLAQPQGLEGPGSSSTGVGGMSNGGQGSASGGAGSNPAVAAAAAARAWQTRCQQLEQQASRAKKARLDKAKQQGKSWALGAASEQEGNANDEVESSEWRDVIEPYLTDEHPDIAEQLLCPTGMARVSQDYLWKRWLSGFNDKGAVDRFLGRRQQEQQQHSLSQSQTSQAKGFSLEWEAVVEWVAVKTGKRAQEDQGTQAHLPKVLVAAASRLATDARCNVHLSHELLQELPEHMWNVPWRLRHYLARHWRGEARQMLAAELQELLQEATELQQEQRSLQNSSYEALLKKARVIGCTTTGAALQSGLLTSQGLAPE